MSTIGFGIMMTMVEDTSVGNDEMTKVQRIGKNSILMKVAESLPQQYGMILSRYTLTHEHIRLVCLQRSPDSPHRNLCDSLNAQ